MRAPWMAAVAFALCALPAVAQEAPACTLPGAVALAGDPPRERLAAEDGLVLARGPRGGLTLWVEEPGLGLSRDLGILLGYGGGRDCAVALPADGLRMVAVALPRGRMPASVEAALCDDAHQGCLPVRLEISGRR